MIKVELIKDCVYHASSYVFDYKKDNEKDENSKVKTVPNKLAKILLDSGHFKKIEEEADGQAQEINEGTDGQVDDPGKLEQTGEDNNPPVNDGQSEG